MARSTQYWFDLIVAEKNANPNLAGYTSDSKVSRTGGIFWCIAACAHAFDVVLDLFKLIIEALVLKSRYGTLPWYASVAKEFQYGDSLVLVDNKWVYDPVVPANQIVQLATAKEANGSVNVKIAKLTGSVPGPLSAPEEAAFITYMNKIKPAGPKVRVINEASDEARFYIDVNYDPLLLTATGELISAPGTYPVEDAVNEYLTNLEFDGACELMKLQDQIQQATGVKSAYISSASARYGVNPFVVFPQRYFSRAGHLVVDPTTPLSATVTYAPYV